MRKEIIVGVNGLIGISTNQPHVRFKRNDGYVIVSFSGREIHVSKSYFYFQKSIYYAAAFFMLLMFLKVLSLIIINLLSN